MRTRRWFHAWVLVAACTPDSPGASTDGDTGGATSTTGTTGTTGATLVTSATDTGETTDATAATTEAVGTSGSTGAATVGTTEAETSGTGEGTTTEPAPACESTILWKEEHFDCHIQWPTATQVHGEGAAAAIQPVTRVFFGVTHGVCVGELSLGPIVLDDPVVSQGFFHGGPACGPALWIGAHTPTGELHEPKTPIAVTMTIEGFAGDWESTDPVDPPRLSGSFAGDLVGPFEAVHCAGLDQFFNNCG